MVNGGKGSIWTGLALVGIGIFALVHYKAEAGPKVYLDMTSGKRLMKFCQRVPKAQGDGCTRNGKGLYMYIYPDEENYRVYERAPHEVAEAIESCDGLKVGDPILFNGAAEADGMKGGKVFALYAGCWVEVRGERDVFRGASRKVFRSSEIYMPDPKRADWAGRVVCLKDVVQGRSVDTQVKVQSVFTNDYANVAISTFFTHEEFTAPVASLKSCPGKAGTRETASTDSISSQPGDQAN